MGRMELGSPHKAEAIVVGSVMRAGERCIRLLFVGEKGERMTADLEIDRAAELTGAVDRQVIAIRDGSVTPEYAFPVENEE